jgi:hypothetical protein
MNASPHQNGEQRRAAKSLVRSAKKYFQLFIKPSLAACDAIALTVSARRLHRTAAANIMRSISNLS